MTLTGIGGGQGIVGDGQGRDRIEGIEPGQRQGGNRGLGIGGEAAEERGRGVARLAFEERHGEEPSECRWPGGEGRAGRGRCQACGHVDQARFAHVPQRSRCREPDFRGGIAVGDNLGKRRCRPRLADGAEGIDGEQQQAGGGGWILDPGEPAVTAGEMIPSSQGGIDEPGEEEAILLDDRGQFRGSRGRVEGHKCPRCGAAKLRIGLLDEGLGEPRHRHLEPLHPPAPCQPDRVDRQPAWLGVGTVERLLPEGEELLGEGRHFRGQLHQRVELLELIDGQVDRRQRQGKGADDEAQKRHRFGAPTVGRADRRREENVDGHDDVRFIRAGGAATPGGRRR